MPILERRAENEVRTLSPDYDDRIALGYLGYVVFLGSNLVLDCLANHQDAGTPILHWFTGTKTQLKRAISMGCWFSVGPAMLRTEKGKSLVKGMPKDRVLTETDGPFAKLNRKSIMPWDVKEATFQLSEVWQIRPEQTDVVLISNFKKLLSKNM
jgi:TatD DNase family protein